MTTKELKFSQAGAEIVAGLASRITKDDLYGRARKIVEADGRLLERGILLPDGRLLKRSQVSSAQVDPDGSPAEDATAWVGDQPAPLAPSSFDQVNELKPAPLARLALFAVADVYRIEPGRLAQGLYETTFNYRKSYQPREALLVVRESDAFLLVGESRHAPFVARTVAYEFFDQQEESGDEIDPLDFSMI
jgi:hypothetical protein